MQNRRSFSRSSLILLAAASLCAAGWFSAAAGNLAAQAPKAKAPAAGSKSPTGSGSKAAPAATKKAPQPQPDDAAERERILKSKEWQETMQAFDAWLSSQSIYDAKQVQRTKARLASGINKMTPAQLRWFQSDMTAKLQVLQSQQAQDAEDYLAQTFAVASPVYAQKLRQKLPDLLSSTAAQVQQQLAGFAAKRTTTIQNQKTFEDAKQQQIAYNESQINAMAQESEHALDRAQSGMGSGGGSASNHFTPARDYFPNVGNDGPFGPGTSIGFGGFGLGFF